ncbi:MAG: Txe/YoeB family addiction module toxin [Bacteroidales bacterium]|nr:Txe/YoeB family addiction module toxin [Bacteroidales bacterium]MBR6175572.1 Txe/YoeB family addiction module toxin [Bacteroidales bacterium]
MELMFSPDALDDLNYWKQSGAVISQRKIQKILKSMKTDACSGLGHPEPLTGNLSRYWSRRIDKKNRIVYEIFEEEQVINVVSLRGHYFDK